MAPRWYLSSPKLLSWKFVINTAGIAVFRIAILNKVECFELLKWLRSCSLLVAVTSHTTQCDLLSSQSSELPKLISLNILQTPRWYLSFPFWWGELDVQLPRYLTELQGCVRSVIRRFARPQVYLFEVVGFAIEDFALLEGSVST